jgi:hydroxymethylpyrimidine pyrophosphatase-like HAD family hydrolase
VLEEIGRTIPIIVITTKDLTFIMPRTPFATAWSAVGGLETRIGNRTRTANLPESQATKVSEAIAYAKSRLIDSGVEIEEKFDANRCPMAFCVDWRHAGKTKATLSEVNEVATYCETLGLTLVRSNQHFFEVYINLPDKGRFLMEILKELEINDGVMYIGDSEMDNTAFNVSNISLGVIHEENDLHKLACDYVVQFKDVTSFLNSLLENHLLFDSECFITQNKDKYMKATLRNNEKRSCSDA